VPVTAQQVAPVAVVHVRCCRCHAQIVPETDPDGITCCAACGLQQWVRPEHRAQLGRQGLLFDQKAG
jgi:hypothetical protein